MKAEKSTSQTKRQKNSKVWTTIVTKKSSKDEEATVSVFTKTNTPKVILKSEKLNKECDSICWTSLNKHTLIKFVCILIMCLIILITFFISLRTYNIVNELADYILL